MKIIEGDCKDVMARATEASIDAVVTDPPYGLSFMDREWDHGVPGVPFWAEALRVLKPGGHLVAFGGTRTYHRLACAIEDAGFEVRDCLMWLYGTGFPKSLNVGKAIDKAAGAEREVTGTDTKARSTSGASALPTLDGSTEYQTWNITAPATDAAKQWDGWGTALKPAWEPIILARKPLTGTVATNVQEHGTGALNVDGCRVGTTKDVPASVSKTDGAVYGTYGQETGQEGGHNPNLGRWPANLVLDFEAGEMLDAQSETHSAGKARAAEGGTHGGHSGLFGLGEPAMRFGDSGGASRFFFVTGGKTCESERNVPTVGGAGIRRDSCETVTALSPAQVDPESRGSRPGQGSIFESVRSTPTQGNVSSVGTPDNTDTIPTTSTFCGSCGSVLRVTDERTNREGKGAEADGSGQELETRFRYCAKASKKERGEGNTHPTVKPVSLMRWLCRLVTQPGGKILDPFAGSGTTGVAAKAEGFEFVGIEQSPEYAAIARKRIEEGEE